MNPVSKKVLFGTAGIPQSTPEISSLSGIHQIKNLGLECMEIEFVKGAHMKTDIAAKIKDKADSHSVSLSIHAPYYINLNSPEEGKRLASQERIIGTARIAAVCGAKSLIFHPGYYGKKTPEQTYSTIKQGLINIITILRAENNSVILRPETMGKKSQFGSLEEILFLCRELEEIQPCIDFSHLHTRTGKINSYDEFIKILKKIEKKLGKKTMNNMHIHVSGAEYNRYGEIKHLNLQDSDFKYDEWIFALRDFGIEGRIISESPIQEKDAIMLKKLYYDS